jgi:hypothetical protein
MYIRRYFLLIVVFQILLAAIPSHAQNRPSPLAAYFETADPKARLELAAAAERDGVRVDRLPALLHGLPLWRELSPGRHELEVEVGFGQKRRITLQIPRGYQPGKAWPLILCYHGWGVAAPVFLSQCQGLLGADADRYLLAAPGDYRQTRLDAPPPFTPEHPAMIRALKEKVHVDSDRVYAVGYSMGGHATWTLALFHSDLLAAALPMASTVAVPADLEGGWEKILPNLAGLPLLHVWGAKDDLEQPGFEGHDQEAGTMAEINAGFSALLPKLELGKLRERRLPGAGHNDASPKPGDLAKLLKNQREPWPKQVKHVFRHLHQGSAHWLEALEWQGEGWFDFQRQVTPAAGESLPAAYGRIFLPLLGELHGEVAGQKIKIERRHVADLVVWLSPELVDLGQPIEIELDGRRVFGGQVAPSLAVALAQAARKRDFERIPWAGVRIDAAGNAKLVDGAMVFPPLILQP